MAAVKLAKGGSKEAKTDLLEYRKPSYFTLDVVDSISVAANAIE